MTSRRTKRLAVTASVVTAVALGAAACGGGGGERPATPGGKIPVLASTNVWGSVLSAVGGDRVSVTSIIDDPSADPHSYETTAKDAIAAKEAKLTLANGGGYDDFFGKLADQAPGVRKLVAFDISGKGGEGHAEGAHDHGSVNEHVWYDLPTVEKVADQVAAQLGELQPDAKQAFTGNAGAFKAKVADIRKKTEQIGTAHPGAKVLATEPVAYYLLEAAKVTDATPKEFSAAIEDEADVPAAAVEQVNQLIAGKQVKAVVNNAQTVTPITEQVIGNARGAGLPVIDVTETLPAGTTDYISWMNTEVDKLAGALNS
jgi:zinc/manganese transport system substrate-binding protein